MKDIIKLHLTNNYKVTLNSYTKFKLFDLGSNVDVHVKSVMDETINLLGISVNEYEEAWDEWIDVEITLFENRVVDLQFEIYEKTGITLDLHEPRFNKYLTGNKEEMLQNILKAYTQDELKKDDGMVEQIRRSNTTSYRSWND